MSCHVVVEVANQVHKLGQAPQLGQNHPEGSLLTVSKALGVEGFCQVYEDGNGDAQQISQIAQDCYVMLVISVRNVNTVTVDRFLLPLPVLIFKF